MNQELQERILVRGVNWLGDAVMTMPALLRLREAKPHAQITLVTPEKLSGLWKNHPAINDTIAFSKSETIWQVARRIRWGNFSTGLIFPNSPRSVLELWLGKVQRRIGYARPGRNIFLTQKIEERAGKFPMRKLTLTEIEELVAIETAKKTVPILPNAHQINDYLHLAATLGANPTPIAPSLHIGNDEIANIWRRIGIPPYTLLFGINPGAEYGPAKRWPAERFAAAAIEIQKRTHCRWVVFGSKSDIEMADSIATRIRAAGVLQDKHSVINLAGKSTLRELCILTKMCRIIVSNDTGPAHVAAAVGTPVVVPFGSTSSELTGPGLPGDKKNRFIQSNVSCSPCFLRECPIDFRCMNGIEELQVIDAVLDIHSKMD